MPDDISCAAAFQTYMNETGSLLAIKLDREDRVLEVNPAARRLLGDGIVGNLLSSAVADRSGIFSSGKSAAHDGRVVPLTFNGDSGTPETLYFRFFPLSQGVLALGGLNLAEQRKLLREFLRLNAELNALTRQLQQANAELREADALSSRHAQEMREHNAILEAQGLASLNLMEDALQAQQLAEKTSRELRESESQFRSLVETAPESIFVVTEMLFSYVNPACCNMFGADSPDQLLHHPVMDRIHPSIYELVFSRLNSLFGKREAVPTVEALWVALDGISFPVETSSVPITYQGQESSLTFARDISERKRAEQRSREFEVAAAEAEAASEAKSTFLSTMSHEIRTPMNAIMGYSQLLMRDPGLSEEAVASLKTINRSGEHLLHIINDVLDMAKIEAGQLQITPRHVNFRGLLHDIEAIFRIQAVAKRIEFAVHTSGIRLDSILADERKISQILINLLGNAFKFTEKGKIDLRVSLNDRTDGRLWLSGQVEDTGIGLTEEEQKILFQPFVQAEGGQALLHGGTGLGLAISRGMATAMGGDITVVSRPGHGSTFSFEIPVERGIHQDSEADRAPGSRGRVLGIQPGQEPPRILIVDDMPYNRDWLSKLLQLLGFSVRTAENGEVAVLAWIEWKPQLVLMDLHMPVMDGLEATRHIRSIPEGENTVIIVLTADVMEEKRSAALADGADAFLTKPVLESDLLESIGKHLGLTYIYDERRQGDATESALAAQVPGGPGSQLPGIPADLVPQMRIAILHGDKALMDRLILTIEDRGDAMSARRLREMADKYQYDRLNELLEKS